MSHKRDDWEKPRSHGQRLTADEIKFLEDCYRRRIPSRDAARKLQCSSRNASKYYGLFEASGMVKSKPTKPAAPAPRFYKSNFEAS